MNDPNSLASLPFDQITQSPVWQNSTVEDRVQITNKYYTDLAASMAGTEQDTDENRQKLATVRRAAIYEVAPFLKQPEDIGVMENVSNAFTKSLSSFHENITLNLLEQNPEEAARYHREMERIYPTREGFSEKVGRITGMMLPTGAALLSAPVTGPLGLTGAAAIATGALYGASSAGAALGDIYAYEQATGEDVSSGKTAAIMAGHAAFEMLTETAGFGKLLGVMRRTGASIGSHSAEKLGRTILSGSKAGTAREMADAVSDYFTHNRAAALSLGWVKMGAIEGIEEMASQVGQTATDVLLYRPYENSRDGLMAMLETGAEGALGGLLLGPLAIGVQAGQASRVRESMYQQSKVLLNETLMAEARRRGGQDEVAVGQEYDRLSATMTPERVDRAAYENPDFMMLKEAFGMAGVELVPVLGTSESKGKGVRYVAKDGTPVAVVDMNRVQGNAAVLEFTAAHEMLHGLETVLGKQGSIELARELATTIPEFSKYKAALDAAYVDAKLAPPTQDYTTSEIVADIFGQAFFKPQFQRAAIKVAAANPAIGRETVTRLKDMRSRFERMGRRVDAYLAMAPEAQAAAGNVIQLPNVAMQAASAKINETTTYLDRITGNFVKGFGEALALQEKTEAAAKVQGDTGEEDLVTGEKVAPLSIQENSGFQSAAANIEDIVREYLPGARGVSAARTASRYFNLGTKQVRVSDHPPVRGRRGLPDLALFTRKDSPGKLFASLKVAAGFQERMEPADDATVRQKLADWSVEGLVPMPIEGVELPPLSIIESVTPEEIFARAFDAKNTQFKKSPEGEALRAVWNNSTRTSHVLSTVFLSEFRFVPPQSTQSAEALAQYRALPEWVKLGTQPANKFTVIEWSGDEIAKGELAEYLGLAGVNPGEAALGFFQDHGLQPEADGSVSADAVLEVLVQQVKDYRTKGDFRQQVAKMAQEELKPHLQDLSRRKVDKEIERLRITRQTAFDVPAATIQRVADMDFKNPLMQRLVSRDDLRAGDVVLQKGTLYWIRGFDVDGSPEALVLRGVEKPFDATPAALDDPNQDPEIAKDYRFGQEALPVTPYYGVELFFDPNWQENPDIMAMVGDAMIAAEKPLMPWEGEAPFSIAEHGTPHVFAPEPGFPHGRFRLDKMGTGEGAQVYGWGIYFAENPSVARAYAQRLSGDVYRLQYVGGPFFGESFLTKAEADAAKADLFSARNDIVVALENPDATNSVYRLDVPDDAIPSMLDWDEALSAQPAVFEKLKAALGPDLVDQMDADIEDSTLVDGVNASLAEGTLTGMELMSYLHRYASESPLPGDESLGGDAKREVAEFLARAGVPGLRYLDQGSRMIGGGAFKARWDATGTRAEVYNPKTGAVQGTFDTFKEADAWMEANKPGETRNYVIWDQGLLDRIVLLERNGKPLDQAMAAENPPMSIAETTWFKQNRNSFVHVNLRGEALDTTRDFTGWVLPVDYGPNPVPNAMNTRYATPGAQAILVPKEFVTNSRTRPDKIKPGFRPSAAQVATIPAEAINPDRTVNWFKVFGAAENPPMSINEELTQMKGTSAAMRNVWKQKQSYEEMAGRAKALLAGTADTYQAKLQKISLTPGDGLTGGAVRVFALRQLADEGIERALSKPMDYLRTYFGIDSRWTDEQAKRLMRAKLSDLELAMLAEQSASGMTLGASAYSSEGLPYSSHKNRLIGWFKTMMDMFGVSTAAKRDISGARAQKIRNGIHNEVKDTLAEMMDQFRTMPEGDFKPAIKGFVTQRIRERFFAKHGKKSKDPVAPMSVAEEAAAGELFDRIFADFGTYYRRLKSPMGDALRQEIAAAYGEDAVADMVASMETYAEVFPDETAAAKPVDPTPAPVKVLVDDLVRNVGKKAQRALQAELAAIYKGEANDILREEYEQTIAPASLKRAAKAAVMTEEEQAKAIDTAMNDLAKAVFKRLKNRQGGAQLVKDGMLTEAGVLRDLQPLKDKMMEAEMPMNVLKGAVNEIMREAGVTISDMLKLNSETFGQVSAGIAADVAGALKAKLAATPALEAFPDVVEAAAAKAGAAVERMLRKRLEDRIETMENTAMADWNFIQRQGRAFVAPFVDVVMQGAKPFRDTAKGAASIILGDQAAWRARVGESLRAASAKAVMLNPAADILLPFRTGLGLPETATMEDVEAALLAVKLPPTIARRVVVEHLAQTERSLADMATSLEPERVQAQVVQELVAEFGPDSADVWVPAVRDLVAERTTIIKKRLVQPKTRKAGQRQDVLDRLLFAAASGSFDDAALMDFIAEQAGMPPMSPETKAKLQVLVQKELDAIIETKDPGSVNVKPFTREISILLAKEVMQSWPKGTFTKASVLRIINAFYASALSGFKTWMVTNPLGSELKLLFTMGEMTQRNALLDPTLKKAGFRGTLSAWSYMLKSFSLAPVKAALFDAVVPGRINRKLSLGGSYVDAGLFDVSQDLGWLSKAHPDVAKNIGAVTNWVYGNLAKYVPRLIWSGDVTQYHRGNEFGSFEKARKEVMEEHPDWSHNQVIDAVYDRLGVTPFGKPKEKFIEAARIESEKLFGPGQPEYRILNRAFEMARAARGDTLFAAGDFAGAQSTFTGTIGVGYAEIEGAYVPQGKDTSLLEKGVRVLEEAKQSDNPFLSLGATALVPFTSIASKIMDATFTYTLFPGIIRYREMVGLAANEENERLRKNYEEGAQLQLVRMVNGTLVTAAMILLAAASRDEEDPWFKITGAGPKDFRKNWQWREAGNRPFTLTIFGKNGAQFDFRTHPLYAFLAAVGTWSDQMNEDPDDRAGLVSAWSSGFLSSLQNQSFMSSIADLMGAISGRDEAAGQQKLMSLFINPALTAAVPASGALRQIEETFFPYPNASRIEDNFFMTFVRTALARLPVANGILPRKVNALGRDIENDRPLETTVGLAGWKRGSDDRAAAVFEWAVSKQAWIPTPSVFQLRLLPPEDAMTVGERRQVAAEREAMMTFEQTTEFLKRRGDIIIDVFEKYKPELAKIPAGDGAKALMSEIASRASIQAKREMRGWRPVKTGGEQMDRVIREKVREALKEVPSRSP